MIEVIGGDLCMMMTDEWLTITQRAEELAEIMLTSDVVADYKKAREAVYSNDALVASINAFTAMKERYEEVQRFGRYHPDYHIVMKEIRQQKRALDMDEQVAALRLAENEVQYVLDEVSAIIAKSVSESVKVPTSKALFGDSSCSTGCGTGGGCSCSA